MTVNFSAPKANVAGPTLRVPGAKWRIADWVVGHFPAHDVYVELFFGSGAILFAKDPARVEIVNDLDDNVIGFFKVLRERPTELATLMALTPWAEGEYRGAYEQLQQSDLDPLERARLLLVATWQQMGRKPVTVRSSWRFRDAASQSPITAWYTLPERILASAERLSHVQISQMDALALAAQVQGSETLLYADPPYLRELRGGSRMYEHEMQGREAHAELIEVLRSHVGPVILSSYQNNFYDQSLPGWTSFSTSARTQTNGQKVETVWLNPVAWKRVQHRHNQPTLMHRDPR